jgi:hypothetical protein
MRWSAGIIVAQGVFLLTTVTVILANFSVRYPIRSSGSSGPKHGGLKDSGNGVKQISAGARSKPLSARVLTNKMPCSARSYCCSLFCSRCLTHAGALSVLEFGESGGQS